MEINIILIMIKVSEYNLPADYKQIYSQNNSLNHMIIIWAYELIFGAYVQKNYLCPNNYHMFK